MEPPKRTNKPPQEIELTGSLIPMASGQPVLLEMPESDLLYLPTFTEVSRLYTCLEKAGIEFDSILSVVDGREFLQSIPADITVIQDPWFTAEGKIRFLQIFRD